MKGPRVVALATILESHDGHTVWVFHPVVYEQWSRIHTVADSGTPRPIERQQEVAV